MSQHTNMTADLALCSNAHACMLTTCRTLLQDKLVQHDMMQLGTGVAATACVLWDLVNTGLEHIAVLAQHMQTVCSKTPRHER